MILVLVVGLLASVLVELLLRVPLPLSLFLLSLLPVPLSPPLSMLWFAPIAVLLGLSLWLSMIASWRLRLPLLWFSFLRMLVLP